MLYYEEQQYPLWGKEPSTLLIFQYLTSPCWLQYITVTKWWLVVLKVGINKREPLRFSIVLKFIELEVLTWGLNLETFIHNSTQQAEKNVKALKKKLLYQI